MSNRQASTGTSLTNGVIVSAFMDEGPEIFYNSSPLSETEAYNLVIKNLPALSADIPLQRDVIRSYGPVSTPREPYSSLAFIFMLKARETEDPRIAEYGRMTIFWIIVAGKKRIVRYEGVLRRIIHRALRFYRINDESDLSNEETMQKIDRKLEIVETGIGTYYITEEDTIESIINLTLVPPGAPIILIDNPNRWIQVLLRDETSSSRKIKLRQIVDDHRQQIPKGTTYKVELISDPLTIQMLLSRLGFAPQVDIDTRLAFRLFDQLTFEELHEFIDQYLAPRRYELVKSVLESLEARTPLSISELAAKTGTSTDLIEEILASAIERGIIRSVKVENHTLLQQQGTDNDP